MADARREASGDLVGTWERQALGGVRQLKLFTETHFVWIMYELPTGRPLGVGGGTYRFDGSTLVEVHEHGSAPQLLGRELTLGIDFRGAEERTQTGAQAIPGVSQDETSRRVG